MSITYQAAKEIRETLPDELKKKFSADSIARMSCNDILHLRRSSAVIKSDPIDIKLLSDMEYRAYSTAVKSRRKQGHPERMLVTEMIAATQDLLGIRT